MRSVPEGDSDREELAKLNAAPWQVALLALNPEYNCWGPGEDYMSTRDAGLATSQRYASWGDFGPWELDDLNECFNFHFEVTRDARDCGACGGCGYNPATRRIADAFYDHEGRGGRWCDAITQDEVQALVDGGRLYDFTHTCGDNGWQRREDGYVPSAEEVNAWRCGGGLGHDAINRWILIETRAKRLGVWGHCPECSGEGSIYTEPAAHVNLVLWWGHPRKGCTRGIEVRITERDVPEALDLLRRAADRNAARFAKVVARSNAGAAS